MLAIIGAGGHGKCVYECFYEKEKIFGFFDEDPALFNKMIINSLIVLGHPEKIVQFPEIDSVFFAIGDNRLRLIQFDIFQEKHYKLPNALHQRTHISPFAVIGKGNFFMGSAIVNPGSVINNCCIINTSATVGHDCLVGNGVQIGPGVNIAGGAVIKEGAFIGIGAKIGPKVTIGAWSVVGAGSVVLKDIPDYSFFAGVPAVMIRQGRINNG